MIAMTLVHDGPPPSFLSNELFDALVSGPSAVFMPVSSLPESHLKKELQRVGSIYDSNVTAQILKLFMKQFIIYVH
jgi:hypothetical protein